MKIIIAIVIIGIAILIAAIFSSCAVSKPTVKAFEVTRLYDGYFSARSGKQVLFFATQDSIYVGRIIKVSIAKQ